MFLPLGNAFNDAVAIYLKYRKYNFTHFICGKYMFGQFKLNCLINYKKTEIAIDQKNRNSYCVMQPWLEVVIESPKKFLGSNEVNLETQISGDCAKI